MELKDITDDPGILEAAVLRMTRYGQSPEVAAEHIHKVTHGITHVGSDGHRASIDKSRLISLLRDPEVVSDARDRLVQHIDTEVKMKTVGQRQKDHDERTRRENVAAQELKERMVDYIESIGEIEPHESDKKSQEIAQRARDRIRDGLSELIGTACDHCETALVDVEPGSSVRGAYIKFFAVCPKCGWNDYIRDFNRQPF